MVKKETKKMVKKIKEKTEAKALGKTFEVIINLTELEEDIGLIIRLTKLNARLTRIGLFLVGVGLLMLGYLTIIKFL